MGSNIALLILTKQAQCAKERTLLKLIWIHYLLCGKVRYIHCDDNISLLNNVYADS